jgi:hypothetical protein
MRKLMPVLFFGLTLLSSTAFAETDYAPQGVPTGNGSPGIVDADNGSITLKGMSRYLLKDYGIEASGAPGIVSDPALPLGTFLGFKWKGDWWARYGFDGRPYGTTYTSENDFTGTGDKDFHMSHCKTGKLEISGAYYMLAKFARMKDDVMQFYADAGCTYDLGWAKVTPSARVMQIVGFGALPNDTLVRLHAPITGSLPFLWKATYTVEPSVTWNLTNRAGHAMTFYPTGSLSWKLTDHLDLFVGAETTSHTKPEFELGITAKF